MQRGSVSGIHIRCKLYQNDKHVDFRLVVFHLLHAPYAYKTWWLCDRLVRVFSDVLVAFLYFEFATTGGSGKYQNKEKQPVVANIKIKKSH